jgi:sigma-E factor negative regulatory protein RseC
MIETKARIVRITDGTAWVAPTEDSGCGGCGSRSSCAVSGLAKYFSSHQKLVPVPCDANAKPGDELTVAVSEGELLKAGILAYLLPAVFGLVAAAYAAANGYGDAGSVAGMAGGVALGLLVSRLTARKARLRIGRGHSHSICQGDLS